MKLSYLAGMAALAATLAMTAHAQAAGFDAEAASRAYLDLVQGPARVRSDAYFEGGYWLILWGALASVAVDALILRLRFAAHIRNRVRAITARPWLVTWLTGLGYVVVASLLYLPWRIYAGFVREKEYGLINQGFGAWLGETGISLLVSALMLSVLIVLVYAAILRWPRLWWVAGAGATTAVMAVTMLVAPVYIQPLFNTYSEMPAGPLRERIVAMAQAHGVPAEHIYVFDASRQSNRISANVSGLGPTIRISLNDNLLNRTSEAEVVAVMGHELGHYVMGHSWRITVGMGLLAGVMLWLAGKIALVLVARFGARCGVTGFADPASMPFLSIGITVVGLLATPVSNLLIRSNESAADRFGLEAAREPDGFARVSMRLAEYRKIEPGRLEEFLFHDHPSGATRVRMAMDWKRRHLAEMPHGDRAQWAPVLPDRAMTSPAIDNAAPTSASPVQR